MDWSDLEFMACVYLQSGVFYVLNTRLLLRFLYIRLLTNTYLKLGTSYIGKNPKHPHILIDWKCA